MKHIKYQNPTGLTPSSTICGISLAKDGKDKRVLSSMSTRFPVKRVMKKKTIFKQLYSHYAIYKLRPADSSMKSTKDSRKLYLKKGEDLTLRSTRQFRKIAVFGGGRREGILFYFFNSVGLRNSNEVELLGIRKALLL